MAELQTKEGELTPAELACYGILPKQQPSNDPSLKVSDETEDKAGKGQK